MAEIRRKNLTQYCLATAVLLFLIARSAFACPMCTELLEHGANAAKAWRFGLGIAWSILLLLGVPFLMVGGFVWMIVRSQKRGSIPGKKVSE